MSSHQALQPVVTHDWRSGFANLLRFENQRWWKTRRWWTMSLVMLVVLNGFLAFGLWIEPASNPGELPPDFIHGTLDVILMWMSILIVLNVLFIVQGAIVGEKQSGVAAWVMSGPVTRSAYILAKFFGNAFGLLMITVVLQGFVIYGQISAKAGALLPVLPFIFAFVLEGMYLLFYLALALMLGAYFASRVPVLAISFAVLLVQPFIDNFTSQAAPALSWLLPTKLPELARFAHRAEALPSIVPMLAVTAYCVAMILLAIWRFRRESF